MDSPHHNSVEQLPRHRIWLNFQSWACQGERINNTSYINWRQTPRRTLQPSLIYVAEPTLWMDQSCNLLCRLWLCSKGSHNIEEGNSASSLLAEAVAIMGALAHSSQREGHRVIYTDSRAASDSLQHSLPNGTIYLLTIVLIMALSILA